MPGYPERDHNFDNPPCLKRSTSCWRTERSIQGNTRAIRRPLRAFGWSHNTLSFSLKTSACIFRGVPTSGSRLSRLRRHPQGPTRSFSQGCPGVRAAGAHPWPERVWHIRNRGMQCCNTLAANSRRPRSCGVPAAWLELLSFVPLGLVALRKQAARQKFEHNAKLLV